MRPTTKKTLDGNTHTTSQKTNSLGWVVESTDAEGATVTYDEFLRPISTKETIAGVSYVTTLEYDEVNSMGQLVKATTGNGAEISNTFDPETHRLTENYVSKNIQKFTYGYDKFGNLAARKDNINNVEETFTYDDIDRLTGVTLNGVLHSEIRYDDAITYTYGIDNHRVAMTEVAGGDRISKVYVGNCEFIKDNGVEKVRTYLTGPYGLFAVVEKVGGEEAIHYIYADHLGSWTTITDSVGNVEQRQSFDAWGNRRNATTWLGAATDEPMFDRGFTGHEHLYNFGLINMNGRMYDPLMSMFLSPDNFIQSPDNSQNFNRYAYCLNNPLRYTDPDGESFIAALVIIGAVIGTYSGGVIANGTYNPMDWDWSSGRTWGYMVCGAAVGALSAYTGAVVAGTGISCCNTLGIMTASTVNSAGTWVYTGGQTDFVVSMGVASYNFSEGEFGYLGKKGNSVLDNIGYTLGAITNLCDLYRFLSWDLLTPDRKLDVIKRTINDKDVRVTYDDNLHGDGQLNKETKEITIGWDGLNKGKGWAKSTLQHEYKHYIDIKVNGNAENTLLDYYAYCKELRNAKQNGLTFSQHNELIKRATDCANVLKISVGDFPKYTFSEWLRSIIYY